MCGRFANALNAELLMKLFDLAEGLEFPARYNIAPSTPILAIRQAGERPEAVFLHWGLIPGWAKDARIGTQCINARAETIRVKPAYRNAARQRRCLIPATAFYEWDRKAKSRHPYAFRMTDGSPMAFAGLWESWQAPDRSPIESCAIVTTDANETVARVHDRMPAILFRRDFAQWLDTSRDAALAATLLKPCASDAMIGYRVSPQVNSPSFDDPRCLEPWRESAGQTELF